MRTWVVERQWVVQAETATKALEAALPGEHEHVRVYEGTEHRPWEDEDEVAAVTLSDGETTGTLIGPADKIHEIVRPEAVVDEG